MLGFESLLERDYMILLEFDESVERFEEQPVKIPFKKGVKAYIPDVLVHFDPSLGPRKSALTEVKHTRDLDKNKDKYEPKFEQAQTFARNRDWEFRVVTELDSRPQRLKTFKFLREYLNIEPESADCAHVLGAIRNHGGEVELDQLLDSLCKTLTERLLLVPTIWHLVATKKINIDYNLPVTDKTLLVLP